MNPALGTDPRRRTIASQRGTATVFPRRRVVVVGGGIAGLAAATGLAERGVTVELLEAMPYLGGRVGGWTVPLPDGHHTGMSRGFHAFFRQYYNLRALLSRAESDLAVLRPVADYPLVDGQGRVDSFRGLPKTPPWNAIAFALRSPTFPASGLLRVSAKDALPLIDVRVPDVYHALDDLDARAFLDRIRFPDTARHLAFDVFSRSFFAPAEQLSAAELALMFHLYFLGSAEGLVFDVPHRPFHELWQPLADYLTGRGAHLRTGRAVERIEQDGRVFRVHGSGETAHADAVVLATDVRGLRTLVANSPALGPPWWREQVAKLTTAPPFCVLRAWLDRPVDPARPAFLATGGRPPLDNVSVLDRYDADAAAWATREGGSVVELHAYAVTGGDDPGVRQDIRARLWQRLHEVYPETREARTVTEQVLWRDDCPLFPPGSFVFRPGISTPVPGLVLAGDGIRVDLPVALMERAATTGWLAANHLLANWGAAGHDLVTVPGRGYNAALRALRTLGALTARFGSRRDAVPAAGVPV
ncbi:FAD-dependent oxidoreductase [Saccharomonospora xinjiangensis]|uniref:FAD-dependent oxidoreductase n=1 Tax=Saccharomonospora xinjiangensis TaxID=75294 RepID=UPI00350EEEDA